MSPEEYIARDDVPFVVKEAWLRSLAVSNAEFVRLGELLLEKVRGTEEADAHSGVVASLKSLMHHRAKLANR